MFVEVTYLSGLWLANMITVTYIISLGLDAWWNWPSSGWPISHVSDWLLGLGYYDITMAYYDITMAYDIILWHITFVTPPLITIFHKFITIDQKQLHNSTFTCIMCVQSVLYLHHCTGVPATVAPQGCWFVALPCNRISWVNTLSRYSPGYMSTNHQLL